MQVTQKAFEDGAPQWAGATWTTPMRSAVTRTRTLDARLAEAGSADALCRAAHASEVPHTEVRFGPVLSSGIEIPDSASSDSVGARLGCLQVVRSDTTQAPSGVVLTRAPAQARPRAWAPASAACGRPCPSRLLEAQPKDGAAACRCRRVRLVTAAAAAEDSDPGLLAAAGLRLRVRAGAAAAPCY